ncbi:MAG: DUF6677 family protein [Terriglobia bacterium]
MADLKAVEPMPTGAEKQSAEKPSKNADSRRPQSGRLVTLCVASWLVPGLGHWMLKRKWRALVLFLAIIGMFVLGLLMQGQFFPPGAASYLERLGYLGELCAGLAMPVTKFFGYGGGNPFFVSSDYGTAYLVSAGMLNLLVILDVYDIALDRKP